MGLRMQALNLGSVSWHGSAIFSGALDCWVGAVGGLLWEVHRKSGEMDSFKESEVEMIIFSPEVPKCRPRDREQTER